MREILFRGKTESGEWVEGSLIQKENYSAIIIFDKGHDSVYNAYLELDVIPETVGQYTGLKDKNGKKIFEGDILKVDDDYYTYGMMSGEIREVYFKDGGFRFKPKRGGYGRGCYLEDDGEFEVIGNIHDNKNLLK